MKEYNDLDKQKKTQYIEYCNKKYGETTVISETNEPMYIDEQGNLIDTKIIINLLFCSQKN